MLPEDCLGSISYTGKLTEDGTIDAKSASQALRGIDTAVHYFAAQEEPALWEIDLPLPVRTRRGSWETLIPHDVLGWVKTAGGLAFSAYLTAAAKKLADNGFKDETLTSILKKSLARMQKLLALGKHLGHLDFSRLKGIRWDTANGIAYVPNEKGYEFQIEEKELKLLSRTPPTILKDIAAVVEEERTLVVTVREGSADEKAETLTRREKHIFAPEELDENEVLFPELTHEQHIELEGIVTRENGRTKTLGFLYKGHVLTCIPASGNMLPYKKNLFLHCLIVGRITRLNKDTGRITEKKPKIVFTELRILSDREQAVMDFIDDSEA